MTQTQQSTEYEHGKVDGGSWRSLLVAIIYENSAAAAVGNKQGKRRRTLLSVFGDSVSQL